MNMRIMNTRFGYKSRTNKSITRRTPNEFYYRLKSVESHTRCALPVCPNRTVADRCNSLRLRLRAALTHNAPLCYLRTMQKHITAHFFAAHSKFSKSARNEYLCVAFSEPVDYVYYTMRLYLCMLQPDVRRCN